MGGTYEEGHMLTFKIILLVSLGSAGDKQKNKRLQEGLSFNIRKKYPHCPLLLVVWCPITVFSFGKWAVLHIGPHKKHWEEIFPELENL